MDIIITDAIRCTSCIHKEVCRFKYDMDNPTLNVPNNIENIEVKIFCKFFGEAQPGVRNRADWQGFEGTIIECLKNPPMCSSSLTKQSNRIIDCQHSDEEIARAKAYQEELDRIDSLPLQHEQLRDRCKEIAAHRYGFD